MKLKSIITNLVKSNICRKSISIFCCVIVLIPCFLPLTVSATDPVVETFEMPFQKPELNENSGYILVLCRDNSLSKYFVRMFNWSTYYYYNYNANGEDDGYDFAFDSRIDILIDDESIVFDPITVGNFNNASFTVSYASSTGFYDFLHYERIGTGNISDYEYIWEDNITVCGYQVFGNCEFVHDNSLTSKLNFACIWGEDLAEYNTLLKLLDVAFQIADYDESILDQLVILNNTSTTISSRVHAIANLLGTFLTRIDSELDVHTGLLKEIRDLLKVTGEETLENVDNSAVNNHNSTSQSLLNNSNASSSQGKLNVTLDNTASTSIWGMVTNFVSLNSTVFGFFITLLSLGVVCLILNR